MSGCRGLEHRVVGVLGGGWGGGGGGVRHELRQGVYGDGKHDGGVVLCRDAVESLQVAQLE